MIIGFVYVVYFGNMKENVLNVDVSVIGIGVVILQGGKLNVFSLKILIVSERKYVNIEREMLVIIWGVKKLYIFVYG